ncbi:MAG: hypothetical protein A2Z21_08245 [Candidatus Fraserbacteria bacterium RBG_16_55_9]|uniref:UDP-N-acetylmuramoyl-tripeptide--D-alanyl-D-alanine ligase n=1 Tax=Fraserbacteria sp. (strain RBG_16_55_9) TaxID=1817864 RepID=A0A1F5UNN7_FRAXR|nr:MAG: hypothetical protein A2Z21_08245 [Candidatus Fraserbacteria bacterium RBG_16_55_9]
MWTIEQIAQVVGGQVHQPDLTRKIAGYSVDSRCLNAGELFIALSGEHTDGHLFLREAFQRGASGALVRQIPPSLVGRLHNLVQVPDTGKALRQLATAYRRQWNMPVVGITGSSGKTTTKELIHALASQDYKTYRSPGNYNTEIGHPIALLNMPDETEVGIFELALQRPGEIRTLCDIAQPTIGVLTSIGDAHLGFFQNREELARAKWELIESLAPNGLAVLNFDAPYLALWAKKLRARVVGFGIESKRAMVRAEHICDDQLAGVAFEVLTSQERFRVCPQLLGRANVYNILAAVAVALELGVDRANIQKALADFKPVPHRLELLRSLRFGLIVDDSYNANSTSVKEALQILARMRVPYRKIFVFGDMLELGDFSVELHRELAGVIQELGIDQVFTLGELARETASALRRQAAWTSKRAICTSNLKELKEHLVKELHDDQNLILVKGSRGMRLDQIVQTLMA